MAFAIIIIHNVLPYGFPGGSVGKASACNVGDLGSIPGSGRSPGEGNGNPLQYSCRENSMDRGVWWATVHGIAKSRTRLSNFTLTFNVLNQSAFVQLIGRQSAPGPVNNCRKEEINTCPPVLQDKWKWPFYFTSSSPLPLCSIKETGM